MIDVHMPNGGGRSPQFHITGVIDSNTKHLCITEHDAHTEGPLRIDKMVYNISDKDELLLWWKVDGQYRFMMPVCGRGMIPFDVAGSVRAPKGADGHIYATVNVPKGAEKKTLHFMLLLDCTR